MNNGDTPATRNIGSHRTKSGRKYDLLFDPEGRFALAVFLPEGGGAEHLVLAFRAESEREALEALIEELDKGSH